MTQQWTQPLAGTPHVTSPYGPRTPPRKPNGALGTSNHQGTDFRAPTGTPVRAIAAGRVIVSSVSPGRGQYVQLDHGDGVRSLYQHLSRRLVQVGEHVACGEDVGRSGASGGVAPHLHVEVSVSGATVDPVPFLAARVGKPAPKPAPKPKPTSAPARVMLVGSRGDDVRELQRALNRLLPATRGRAALVVDGSFGWRTEARVREAQRMLGLVVDGVCGPLTRKALRM